MTPEERLQKLQRLRELQQMRSELGASEEKAGNPISEFFSGAGRQILRTSAGLGNLMQLDRLAPGSFGDDTLKMMDAEEAARPKSTARELGKIGGSLAATAPLGGVPTAAMRLPMALAAMFGQGAVQGAAEAAPDEQATGAMQGGLLSAGLGAFGRSSGRAARGLVNKSDDAELLLAEARRQGVDLELPLANAASDADMTSRYFKTVYQGGLPILPGVGGRLRGQADEAADKTRKMFAQRAVPPGKTLAMGGTEGPEQIRDALRTMYDDVYDETVNKYAFQIPSDMRQRILSRIDSSIDPVMVAAGNVTPEVARQRAATIIEESVAEMMADPALTKMGANVIGGKNLMSARARVRERMRPESERTQGAMKAGSKAIDDVIRDGINPADQQVWDQLPGRYQVFAGYDEAVRAANKEKGNFRFGQLADAMENRDSQMRDLAVAGRHVFDNAKIQPTWQGVAAMTAPIGGVAFGNPLAATAMGAAGPFLSSRSAQRALMGDTRMQKALKEYLAKYPDLAPAAGYLLRQSAVSGSVGE
jgi:hypothetical protein